jgi:hypothetical protein
MQVRNLHKIGKPHLLVLLLAERRRDGKIEHFDTLAGIFGNRLFGAESF